MQTSNNKAMWRYIIIPILIYLVYIFYFQEPTEPIADVQMANVIVVPLCQVNSYIEKYAGLAQKEMQINRIPASITLGQALIESQYGTSELAVQANNHFGIKIDTENPTLDRHCLYSNEWIATDQKMKSMLSCFRKYKEVGECYGNHSDFLTGRKWYAPLFDLEVTDYKKWAEGLQKAGYATDPKYAVKLISIIEKYKLTRFDNIIVKSTKNGS